MMPRICQFTEIYGAPNMSIYRDYMMPRICQFTEIYDAPTMSIYRDLWCPEYVNLQRSYGAPPMSIYRDFMVVRLCQFTEILCYFDYRPLQERERTGMVVFHLFEKLRYSNERSTIFWSFYNEQK